MNQAGLCKVLPCSDIASHAEVGILVDGAGNKGWNMARNGLIGAEDVRKRGCERGCALNGSEMDFAYARAKTKASVSMSPYKSYVTPTFH